MNKILIIARREYLAMVATKTFLITLVMMPILMFGGLILVPTLSKITGGQTRTMMVVDGTGKLGDLLKTAAEARNKTITENKSASEVNPTGPLNASDIFDVQMVEFRRPNLSAKTPRYLRPACGWKQFWTQSFARKKPSLWALTLSWYNL
jgi:ABC-type Na+ efflux pump permease subunit